MNIHEYQAKEILKRYKVTVPKGAVAFTSDEAYSIAKELGDGPWVVKAQIHAGGRGKAGGVKLIKDIEEVKTFARELLGKQLVTYQTGPEGKEVKKVLVEEGCNIKQELYLGMVIDRASSSVTVMASPEGGVEIEKVAAKTSEKIFKETIDPALGLMPFQARKLAFSLGLDKAVINKAAKFILSLYQMFVDTDLSIAEINPLVITEEDSIFALDAKMVIDDSGLFRHRDIEEMRDLDEEDPRELEASRNGLSYISLDGNIGCMVNGAGLAMSTMDIIKLHGGEPANFLDVGGGASKEQVETAFKIILSDDNVKAVLVNIFGGIMKCDIIAEGIIAAAREIGFKVPLVVRLEGTNVDRGKRLLDESAIDIITATNMTDAAEKVVRTVKKL